MAAHIQSIRTSGIPQVSKAEFYSKLAWGDLIFTEGFYEVSKGIKVITGSPLTHVLMAWLPLPDAEWITLEATKEQGVHIGRLTDYVDFYNGDLVMCHRTLTDFQKMEGLKAGFKLLDDRYDTLQEVKIAAHRLCKLFPVSATNNELFCSGLQYVLSVAQGVPLKKASIPGEMPTPEDNYTDPSVIPICAKLQGAI